MKNQKGFAGILILLTVMALAALVGVSYFFGVNKINTNLIVPTSSPTISALPTSDPTINWNIYNNSKALFSFKYPVQFKIDPDCIENSTCNESFLTLSGIGISVNQFLNSNNCQNLANSSWSDTVQKTYTKVDNIDSLLISNDNFKSDGNPISQLRVICTTIGDKSVKIQIQILKGSGSIEIFNQILSTFKFTPDPTANWKTFTNTIYNFSFKYPDNYSVGQNGMNSDHPETSGAVFAGDYNAKNFPDEPRFTVSLVNYSDKISTLEQKAKEFYDKWGTYSVNTAYPAENNKIVSAFEKTTYKGKDAYVFTIKGSYYSDGASEGISASRDRKYIFVMNGNDIFLIRTDIASPVDQILSTFQFTK